MIEPAGLAAMAHAAGLREPSIVVRSTAGDVAAVLDPMRPLYPASMIKLPIALVLAAFCEAGAYRLDDVVAVEPANVTACDAPSPFVAGYEAELGELARAMLSASDNTATNVLIDVLGRETITAACASAGLRATAVRRKLSGGLPLLDDPEATGRNTHPAADAAELLTRLARDPSPGTAWILDALGAQRWNDKLSPGFAPGDRFAHKTGETDEVSHDGGILTLPDGRRFVIVAYTALPATPDNDVRFAAFARMLRDRLADG